MPLDTLYFQTGDSPTASVIIMHGLGSNATDFIPVARQWNLRAVGDVRFVFPEAPVRPVTLNGGMRMQAWYDILGADLLRREDEKGLRESAVDVQALIAREIAQGIPASRIVLGGFSQGCAMTLLAGLRAPQRLAGLLGMSGYLPLAATTAVECSEANRGVPIFLGHGRADPIVPFDRALATRDALVALGYPVEWHDYAMQHSVCEDEILHMQAWLLKVLARA
ncbi:MAG: carboxylesterase [Burkholderiaceae bacterium]